MRRVLILIMLLILAACGGSDSGGAGSSNGSSDSNGNNNSSTSTASETPDPVDLTATAIVALATESGNPPVGDCETGIVSETDADAAAALKSELEAQGLTVVNVIVTINRLDCDNESVVNAFASAPITVANVSDDTALAGAALSALRGFVVTDLPQPATLSMQFETGSRQRPLTVNYDDAQSYLDDGLTGAELIEALGG